MNFLNNAVYYLAAKPSGNSTSFWSSQIGSWFANVLNFVGVIVVIIAVLQGIKAGLAGKVGDVAKIVFIGFVLGAFCFQPELIDSGIKAAGALIKAILGSMAKFG